MEDGKSAMGRVVGVGDAVTLVVVGVEDVAIEVGMGVAGVLTEVVGGTERRRAEKTVTGIGESAGTEKRFRSVATPGTIATEASIATAWSEAGRMMDGAGSTETGRMIGSVTGGARR